MARPHRLFGLVAVSVLVLFGSARSAEGSDFLPRLSAAPSAMEYWDITAWFESGERLSARFLITNQGPGTRTAAAVGHLLRPSGELVPIKYGRTSEAWTLSKGNRRLKIASAVLDLSGSAMHFEVDSTKRGVLVQLDIPASVPTALEPVAGYVIEVLPPLPVRARYQLRGMSEPASLTGFAAVTHTAIDKPEAEIAAQRSELFAVAGDRALYLNELTTVAGAKRAAVVQRRPGAAVEVLPEAKLNATDPPSAISDRGYAVPRHWDIVTPSQRVTATMRREYLRWDPLEIVPQPFRFLLSLQGAPRRVWSDAEVVTGADGESAPGAGVAVVTFARPVEQ